MKIAVIGYSGSGKSTLSALLGEIYGLDVLHLDSVHHMPGWVERDLCEEQQIVTDYLNSHDAWVIDGNYSKTNYERRMEEADLIIMMLFNRFSCLKRAFSRYLRYRNTTRPDMGEGCNEKFDAEFAAWILWKGRSRKTRMRYQNMQKQYGDKVIILRNQRELNRFCAQARSGGIAALLGNPV